MALILDEFLSASHLTEAELKLELALALFQREHLTLGQAALLAGLPQLEFQRHLASREITIHYGVEELELDLEWAKKFSGS